MYGLVLASLFARILWPAEGGSAGFFGQLLSFGAFSSFTFSPFGASSLCTLFVASSLTVVFDEISMMEGFASFSRSNAYSGLASFPQFIGFPLFLAGTSASLDVDDSSITARFPILLNFSFSCLDALNPFLRRLLGSLTVLVVLCSCGASQLFFLTSSQRLAPASILSFFHVPKLLNRNRLGSLQAGTVRCYLGLKNSNTFPLNLISPYLALSPFVFQTATFRPFSYLSSPK